ncbi:hypothetical protein [Microbacterium sp.]|uniref:hypothetical protein n=1 Tax=Microbacterium sp. TaxID=51671 RepID=UPI003F9CEE95
MDEHRTDPAEERSPRDTAEDTARPSDNAPLGGDETTEEQLDADNEVEEDMLKSLNPDDSPA